MSIWEPKQVQMKRLFEEFILYLIDICNFDFGHLYIRGRLKNLNFKFKEIQM
jgi:hypothetical protein